MKLNPPLPFAVKNPAPRDELSAGARWSVILHGSVIVILLLKALVFPGKPIPYIPTLRVDVVGLPDVLKRDLNKLANSPPPKAIADALKKTETEIKKAKEHKSVVKEKADPHEMVLKPKVEATKERQKKLKSALDRIKALNKIGALDSKVPSTDTRPSAVVKGNMISKGTSLSGDARESAEPNYLDQVRDRLQQNWALPIWLSRQNYSAQVQIYINRDGTLSRYAFIKPSGNPQFDEAIKRTLTESQPFAQPPAELHGPLLANGILIGFPL